MAQNTIVSILPMNVGTVVDILAPVFKFDKQEGLRVVAEAIHRSVAAQAPAAQAPAAQAPAAPETPTPLNFTPTTPLAITTPVAQVIPAAAAAAPAAPAKIPTPQELWTEENRARIVGELPAGTKKGEITKALKEGLKNLSDAEKQEVKDKVKQLKKNAAKAGGRRKKDPAAPKAPQNAFMRFAASKRAEVKEELEKAREDPATKITAAQVQSRIGQLWKEASEEAKKPFEEAYEKDKEAYATAKAEYENN